MLEQISSFLKVTLLVALSFLMTSTACLAQSDYYAKKAAEYTREAEYYQKKADGYRREAEYYLKKAESYEREAAYYTKHGNIDRADSYSRYARSARDSYKTKMRYASQAEEKAADYLKKARDMLRR